MSFTLDLRDNVPLEFNINISRNFTSNSDMVYDSLPYIHMIIGSVWCAKEKKRIDRKKCELEEAKGKRISGVEDKIRVKEIDVSMAFHVGRWQPNS